MLVSRERHILIKILASEGRGCVFFSYFSPIKSVAENFF